MGAYFLTVLLEYLRPVMPGMERYLLYGGIALVLYVVRPEGIYSLITDAGRKVQEWRR